MNEILQAAFRHWTSIYIFGVDPVRFQQTLERVLAHQPEHEHTILLCASPPTGARSGHFLLDAPLSEALRAALRQDPDCLVIDQRTLEARELVLTAQLTGHRIIAGVPVAQADQALASIGQEQAAFLEHTLFLDGTSIHQVQDGGLVDLTRQPARFPQASLPPVEDFTPLEVPAEWGPAASILPALRARLGPLGRPAWVPRRQPGPDPERGSKFSGLPLVPEGESWPRCRDCSERLQLVLQLELAQAPAGGLEGEGWFQLFYCSSDRCSAPAPWEPFSGAHLVRRIQEPVQLPAPDDRLESRYPVQPIQGWDPIVDYPHSEERPELSPVEAEAWYQHEDWLAATGSDERAHNLRGRFQPIWDHLGLQLEDIPAVVGLFSCYPGDKLGGWPAWTQAADYPDCPRCHRSMHPVAQINNDGSPPEHSCLGQLFAADGNGHVFQCPDHSDELAFRWSCS